MLKNLIDAENLTDLDKERNRQYRTNQVLIWFSCAVIVVCTLVIIGSIHEIRTNNAKIRTHRDHSAGTDEFPSGVRTQTGNRREGSKCADCLHLYVALKLNPESI